MTSYTKHLKFLLFLFLVACAAPQPKSSIDTILENFHNSKSEYVMVAAHRAAHKIHPENSLPAIKHSIALGIDIVELDVKTTKDNIPVLMHDGSINRTTNGSGKVEDYTLEELKKFRLINPNGTLSEESIPTFEEVLNLIHGNIMVDVDLKTDNVKPIVETVKKTKTQKYVFYFDNDYDVLKEVLNLDKNAMLMPRAYSYEMADSALNMFSPEVVHIEPSFYSLKVSSSIRYNEARIWINALGETDAMIRKGETGEAMDKLLLYNANIIQTDEPEIVLSYLISKGLHN